MPCSPRKIKLSVRTQHTEEDDSIYFRYGIYRGKYHRRLLPVLTDEEILSTAVKAADEIIKAGLEAKCGKDARKKSQILREKQNKSDIKNILEYCIALYTESSFLFRALHRDLGNAYTLESRSLYNYELLLYQYVERYGKEYQGRVYRGARLDDPQFSFRFTSSLDEGWCSNTYLSTSKSWEVASLFGNTLLVIDIDAKRANEGKAIDISEISVNKTEGEVLLTPEFMLFKSQEPEYNAELHKHILYFTSRPSDLVPSSPELIRSRRKGKSKEKTSYIKLLLFDLHDDSD